MSRRLITLLMTLIIFAGLAVGGLTLQSMDQQSKDISSIVSGDPLTISQIRSQFLDRSKCLTGDCITLEAKPVKVRGFLYKGSNDHWILASEPNLKSCCVGSADKMERQLLIYGDLPNPPPQTAVTIEGFVKMDESKRLIMHQIASMDNSQKGLSSKTLTLTALLGITLAFMMRKYKFKPSGYKK